VVALGGHEGRPYMTEGGRQGHPYPRFSSGCLLSLFYTNGLLCGRCGGFR
jgi:hypothetical protein